MQVKAGHLQPAVGIPRSASPDIEQPSSGFGEHVAAVDEVQINSLAGSQWLGKNDGDQVIAPPRQLRAFERLILNKLHRAAVGFYLADLEEPGQFEEHGSLAGLSNFKLQACVGVEPGGWRHFCPDFVLRNIHRLGFRFFSHDAGCVAGTTTGLPQGECAPHVVVKFTFDCLLLARPDLLRGERVEVEIESPEISPLESRVQHAIVVRSTLGC